MKHNAHRRLSCISRCTCGAQTTSLSLLFYLQAVSFEVQITQNSDNHHISCVQHLLCAGICLRGYTGSQLPSIGRLHLPTLVLIATSSQNQYLVPECLNVSDTSAAMNTDSAHPSRSKSVTIVLFANLPEAMPPSPRGGFTN